MLKYVIHTILFLFLSINIANCQFSKGPLNSYTYALAKVEDDNVNDLIEKGFRAFWITNDRDLESIIRHCNSFLYHKKTVFYFYFNSDVFSKCSDRIHSELQSRLFQFQNYPWPTEKELLSENKYFVLIPSQNSTQLIHSFDDKYNGYSDFIIMTAPNNVDFLQKMNSYWTTQAHPVNFVLLSADELATRNSDIMTLNASNRISGRFVCNGKSINGVKFSSHPDNLHNTQFCLPFGLKIQFIPLKDGYSFTPQIVSAYYSTEYHFIEIEAYPIPLSTHLICDLKAGGKELLPGVENAEIKKDNVAVIRTEGEKVFSFNEKSCMSFSPLASKDSVLNISFAFRVKFNSKDRFQTIVSQGSSFILKLFDNHFCFTLPDKKDYKFTKVDVQRDIWYNVCLSVSNGTQLKLYLNNKLADTCTILKTTPSTDQFLIGSSLFEEHLKGEMTDIRIWNRTLGDHEVFSLWKKKNSSCSWFWLGVSVLLVVMTMGGFIWVKRRRRNVFFPSIPVASVAGQSIKTELRTTNSLLLFGNFSLLNAEGRNLVDEMYPKVKQLFLLMVLYSCNNKGISTTELNDLLWPGMSEISAKNNRGVTMQNLRRILAHNSGLQVSFHNKSWFVEGLDSIYVDYLRCRYLVSLLHTDIPDMAVLNEFIEIVSYPLLKDIQLEFTDHLKAQENEILLGLLLRLADLPFCKDKPEILLGVANALFAIDEVNEDALQIRIQAYRLQKNETMIRVSRDNFNKKYQAIYNEPYSEPKR